MKRNNHASVVRLTSLAIAGRAGRRAADRSKRHPHRAGPDLADAGSHRRRRDLVRARRRSAGLGCGVRARLPDCRHHGRGSVYKSCCGSASPFWLDRRVRRQGRSVRPVRGTRCKGAANRSRRSAAYAAALVGAGREHGRVCRRDADGLPARSWQQYAGGTDVVDVSVRGVHRRELFGGIRRQRGC